MMKIKSLDKALRRKIAAGEVIERPSSVLKELLENSLDAKSETISVSLVDGGISAIVISDDGEGMDRGDLELCTRRYTTSKIETEADLNAIETLGFRGEALASIAEVSRMQVTSCPRGDREAHELVVVGGEEQEPIPAARAPGTTVKVRDLFFNLPARRRFLKSARSESFHANRVLQRLALTKPGVGWSLKHGQRTVLTAPAVKTLTDRVAQIYGAKTARRLIAIEAEQDGIAVSGLISRPDLKRGNRRDQILCVNGRPIEDRGLSYILASAYKGMLRPGTFPIALIQINLPSEWVDANIHPRKREVRFADAKAVQAVMSRALQTALSSQYVVPSMAGVRSSAREQEASYGAAPLKFALRRRLEVSHVAREEEKTNVHGDRRVIGQLQNTYLLVEGPDGLEIFDQHIAHERILYEGLKEQWEHGEISRQQFLLPVRIELPFEQAERLAGDKEKLQRVGIVLEEFGGGTFLLREYPSALTEGQSRYGFQRPIEQIVDLLAEGDELKEKLFDHLLATLACSAAIKAGDHLPLEQQQGLVERLMNLDNPYTCPHGRPIIFSIPRAELDRKFKRA
ncbi:MAG: DNA mismatch repair endonuclease MutL [Candidatus Bipolaricaulota bacterium]|nr:DNA mismatch repair endonuclease MutL [Candidatus Bipolaricaulota bacterium]